MKNCVIVGAAPLYRTPEFPDGSLIIAADGGYEQLRRLNIRPDAVIGDFDSLSYRPDAELIELPTEKDDTDMLAAIRYGISKGCHSFHIYGGAGGRFDHTLANLQCLAYLAAHGRHGFLYAGDYTAVCIRNGKIDCDGGRGIVSVFAHSGIAEGVCLAGLKYELRGAVLNDTYPLGVSNELTGAPCRISVRNGSLMIILPYGDFKIKI